MDDRTRTLAIPSPVETFRSRTARVEVRSGPAKGLEVPISGFSLRIGSAADNDLVLPDETVSRNHARIELDPLGYRLRDLGSKNGTRVGDLRIADAFLEDGCRIRVGAAELRFRLNREEREDEVAREHRLGRLVGRSLAMRKLFALLQKVAATGSTVLLEGESGTGKELVAETLHALSDRSRGPFEVFDCTAVPAALLESHLFGHVRGAFTGADAERAGALERAHRGTLLVDEVGELPLELQGTLLRAIDRKEYRRLGAQAWQRTDARILAATNRTLEKEVDAGRFRQDLFFRLAVVRIRVPPLRERPEDIPLLVEDLEEDLGARELGRAIPRSQVEAWLGLPWPGNVRELRNAVERTLLLGPEEAPVPPPATGETFWRVGEGEVLPYKDAKARLLGGFEAAYWKDLLARFEGNVTRAAAAGGIHRKSLEYLIKKLGIERSPGQNLR